MDFLEDPSFLEEKDFLDIPIIESEIVLIAKTLLYRLFPGRKLLDEKVKVKFINLKKNTSSINLVDEMPKEKKIKFETIDKEFEDYLKEEKLHKFKNKLENNIIDDEIKLLKSSGKRAENLENLYNSLKTIKPTSVEPERAFSVMSMFVRKLRTRLNDETVDAMIFLRQTLK